MGILLLIIILFVEFALGSWIVQMNVNDIIFQGHVDFWNAFWILLVGAVLFGTSASAK
jgi:hypothetical protein